MKNLALLLLATWISLPFLRATDTVSPITIATAHRTNSLVSVTGALTGVPVVTNMEIRVFNLKGEKLSNRFFKPQPAQKAGDWEWKTGAIFPSADESLSIQILAYNDKKIVAQLANYIVP